MNWLIRALSSSVGKKYVTAITGLLLCGFLVVHLAGNLLLYVSEQAYNDYAHALHEQEWMVKVAEVVLLVLFGGHIWLAFVTSKDNWSARDVDYQKKQTKQDVRVLARSLWPDRRMLLSGLIVLGFLLLHVWDFTFEGRGDISYPEGQPYLKARRILLNPISGTVYFFGSLVLGWHLWHGVGSAFHSLGINHPKYNSLIWILGILFAITMGVGFASFVVWAVATS